jgi:GNAT superfamily N-acetyltransferase
VSAESPVEFEPLNASHEVLAFDCGDAALNDYLAKRALPDQQAEKSRTYVARRGSRVAGFFGLAAGSVRPEETTERMGRGQGRQAIPVILLTRFAVDRSEQRRGLGEAMLVEALGKCAQAADSIGARAVLVHAKNEQAQRFYTKYGFEPSPTNPLHLALLMKDIRKTLAG